MWPSKEHKLTQRRLTADWPPRESDYVYTVRTPLTGCQVTSSPRDGFSRYLKRSDILRTALVHPNDFFQLLHQILFAGEVYFKWLSIATFYSIVCVSTVAILVGFTLVERFNLSRKLEISFGNKTVEYAYRLFICSVFIIPTNHWPETGKKIKFLNSWSELQVWDNLHVV